MAHRLRVEFQKKLMRNISGRSFPPDRFRFFHFQKVIRNLCIIYSAQLITFQATVHIISTLDEELNL